MGFLAGKKALIVGLATDRSIAYGISQAMRREGAELAFTYQNDRIKDRVVEIAGELGSTLVMPMDVAIDAEIAAAFARREGRLVRNRRHRALRRIRAARGAHGNFRRGDDARELRRRPRRFQLQPHGARTRGIAAHARPRRRDPDPLYLGAVRSIPSYNVMGLAKASLEANVRFLAADLGAKNIRVNAISAGPIKTLAAAGIPGFRKMLHHVEQVSPLKRNVTVEDVGNAAAFLCSDLAAGITGETLYVDAGYSHVGMSFPE